MPKHFARLHVFAILLGGLLLSSACAAATTTPAPYTDGVEYVTLPAPHQRYSSSGKVEVTEVFSYACIHCAEFAPTAEILRDELPAGVEFKLLPAPFNDQWIPFAQAYYAAKQLGVVKRTHLKLFLAKFGQHYPIDTLDDLADFYARQGVDRAAFMRIAKAPETTAKIKSDYALIRKWGVDGTPTIVVDGKYRVATVHSYKEMVAVTLWLVQRELKGK